MEQDPTRMCELLVGLGDVDVVGVEDEPSGPLVVHIRLFGFKRGVGSAMRWVGASRIGVFDTESEEAPGGTGSYAYL